MNNYRNLMILILLVMVLVASGCNSEGASQDSDKTTPSNAKVEKIEIIHFHGTNQCTSCITVGAYAEETVNTYFADELKSGKIVFAHINGELPENREKVILYGATGSSLWIGVYDDTGFHAEQNTNVWYKTGDKEGYKTYLKGVIDKRLAGDMS